MKVLLSRSLTSRLLLAAMMMVMFLNGNPAQAELTIVSPNQADLPKNLSANSHGVFHLGDTLIIRATGKNATDIQAEVTNITHRKLALYLNGIEIPELTSSFALNPPPDKSDKASPGVELQKLEAKAKAAESSLGKELADITMKETMLKRATAELEKKDYGVKKKEADILHAQADAKEQAAVIAEKANAGNAEKLREEAKAAKGQAEVADKLWQAKEVVESASKDLSAVYAAGEALTQAKAVVTEKKLAAGTAQDELAKAQQGEVDISFIVERHSESKESREAWDKLLRPLSFKKAVDQLEVALAIGAKPPEYVNGLGVANGKGVLTFAAVPHFHCAVAGGLVVMALCLLVIYYNNQMLRENGNPSYAISLGRTQMAFWGVIVLSCFVGVLIACGGLEAIPAQTLILLGISAGTALSARAIDGDKPPTPKSAHSGFHGFLDDILTGDSGASFHRVQVAIWTLVLGAYFIFNVAQVITMPEFPETLLILMGISNGTYLGFKMQEGKFDVSPVEMKQAALNCRISGGTAPYQWALSGDLPAAVTVKNGSQPRSGPLVLQIGQPASSGKLTLTVTDKAGNSSTQVFDFSKPKVDGLILKDRRMKATISEFIAPYSLMVEGTALVQSLTLDKQTDAALDVPLDSLLKKDVGGDLKLTVTDARGLIVEAPLNVPPLSLTTPSFPAVGKLKTTASGGTPNYAVEVAGTALQDKLNVNNQKGPDLVMDLAGLKNEGGDLVMTVTDARGMFAKTNTPVAALKLGKLTYKAPADGGGPAQLTCEVSGSLAPYQWTLKVEPEHAMDLKTVSCGGAAGSTGTLNAPSPLTLVLPAVAAAGNQFTLEVTSLTGVIAVANCTQA